MSVYLNFIGKIIPVIAIALIAIFSQSKTFASEPNPSLNWIAQLGTTGTELGYAVGVDSFGNSYLVGHTSGSLNTPVGSNDDDAYLAKVDDNGQVLWINQFGTTDGDTAYDIVVDWLGNSYVTGYTKGGLGGNYEGGLWDGFVSKFDTNGNVAWSTQIGTSEEDVLWGITLGVDATIYVTGYTWGDFTGSNLGQADMFIAAIDSASGQVSWSSQFGSSESDYAVGISIDTHGNIYVGGRTEGNIAGDNQGGDDAVLAKYDSQGNQIWVRQYGGVSADYFNDVAADNDGSIYGVGKSDNDVLVVKMSEEGDLLWDRMYHQPGDVAFGVETDSDNRVYVSGRGNSPDDAYIMKLDPDGNVLWLDSYGTGSGDEGHRAALGPDGKVYLAGVTYGDLGDDNAGGRDSFVLSLTQTVAPPPPITGDVNGDGYVGIADLNIVLSNWNVDAGLGNLQLGDLTGDGFVGIDDLNRLLSNWNAGTPPLILADTYVPEPIAMGTLSLAGLMTLVLRCRS